MDTKKIPLERREAARRNLLRHVMMKKEDKVQTYREIACMSEAVPPDVLDPLP